MTAPRPFAIEHLESRELLAAGGLEFGFAIGTNGGAEAIAAQATDAAGNLYVAGTIGSQPVDFNPSPRKTFTLTPGGANRAFLAKYTPAGGLVWARLVPTATGGAVTLADVAIDRRTGDLLVVGDVTGSVVLDTRAGGAVSLASDSGSSDGFWGRVDPGTGVFSFATRGTSAEEADHANRIDSDAAGNVYITGSYGWTIIHDGDLYEQSAGYLAKFNAKGRFAWSRGWRPAANFVSAPMPTALAVTADGQAYVGGVVAVGTEKADFDRDAATTNDQLTGVTAFLASYDTAGTFQFVGGLKFPGPNLNGNNPRLTDLATDAAGNVVAVGSFEGVIDFNFSSRIFNLGTAGAGRDGFAAKYARTGKLVFANQVGADAEASGEDSASSVAVDAQGYIYAGGTFIGLTRFSSTFRFRSDNDQDGFIAKYQANGTLVTAWQFDGDATDDIRFLAAGPGKAGPLFASGTLRASLDIDPSPAQRFLRSADWTDWFTVKLV
ncbi:MAG: hypothetical protein ACAI43_12285 [Phycisphaerae bacterium]|nr:hypothetical protein [Tepidisphaeraceae bacterium]